MGAIEAELEQIVGSEGVCKWENLDEGLRQRIAIKPGSQPDRIVYPRTQEEVGEVMALAYRHRWRVLPMGGGSKLHWGGLIDGIDLVVSTQRLNGIVEHAVGDFTLTVEAGTKLADIQATVAKTGQMLAIDPAYAETATIGAIVATGDTGSWRQRYNSVRDQLIGISFCRYDGQGVKAGGRVVKNVAGYDLMKLLTGSYGTLGIVTQVTFRLYPLPIASQTVVLGGDGGAIADIAQTLLASTLTPTAADVLSTQVVERLEVGTGMGLMVRFQSLPESVEEQSKRLLEIAEKLGVQSQVYREKDETDLWQRSRKLMELPSPDSRIVGKMGVRPTEAVSTLTQLDTISPQMSMGLIHASSGLGRVMLEGEAAMEAISKLRSTCQGKGGFLTVLEAPISVKQQVDIWGYNGTALSVMKALKHQFDPDNILSPNRFLV